LNGCEELEYLSIAPRQICQKGGRRQGGWRIGSLGERELLHVGPKLFDEVFHFLLMADIAE
jgi:hypothetical protein